MRQAVLYARVLSKDQEREGFSIPAQLKFLREYAQTHELNVLHEFVDVETAKATGRKQFGEMVRFLRDQKTCRVVLVEKTDRLYRNFCDCVTLEDLDIEIHLPKEGQVISKDSKSQAKLVHGIQLVVARNYIENLRDEVRKGMREKAAQGIYPSRPPLGYRNNKLLRTIEVDPLKRPDRAANVRPIRDGFLLARQLAAASQSRVRQGLYEMAFGKTTEESLLHRHLRMGRQKSLLSDKTQEETLRKR